MFEDVPVVEADEWDKEMLAQVEKNKNDTVCFTSEQIDNENSGKILLRLPKSLHKNLKAQAQKEGVTH